MQEEYWIKWQWEVAVAGPDQPRRWALTQPYALIGSDPACDVVLPDSRLPPRCYLALLSADGLMGVSLVGSSTSGFRPLDGQRGIRAGRFRLQFVLPALEAEGNGARDTAAVPLESCAPRIRWRIDGRPKYALLRDGQPVLFGRSKPSRLRLDDRGVSSVHGVIFPHGDCLWLIDLGSTNGTRIHGRRVRCARLEPGQSFHVGGLRIKFDLTHTPANGHTHLPAGPTVDRAALEELARQHAAASAEIERLSQHTQELQQNVTERLQQFAAIDQQAIELTERQQRLQQQQAELDQRQAELDRRQVELEQRHTEVEQRYTELGGRQTELDQRHTELSRRQTELDRQLEEMELHYDEQWRQLDEARQNLVSAADDWEQAQGMDRELLAEERRLWNEQREREEIEWEQQRQEAQVAERAERESLHDMRDLLVRQRAELEVDRATVQQFQVELEARSQSLAEQQQRQQQQRDQQIAELTSAKERLLVRRIRIQRELQQREAELAERQAQLEQREQQLDQRPTVPLQSPRAKPWPRKVPLPPGVPEFVPADKAPQPDLVPSESLELANPLLESADFTDLLREFIRNSDGQDGPAGGQHGLT